MDLSLNQVNRSAGPWRHFCLEITRISQIEKLPEFGLSSLTMIDLNLNDNMIHYLGGDLWRCDRLRILRLQNNSLSLNAIPETLLAQSFVSTLMLEGNLFETKESSDLSSSFVATLSLYQYICPQSSINPLSVKWD